MTPPVVDVSGSRGWGYCGSVIRRLLVVLSVFVGLVLVAAPARAQIAFVQSTGLFFTGSASNITANFASTPKAGNTIVVMAWTWSGAGTPTISASDNKGNTYTSNAQVGSGNGSVGWENAAVLSAPVTSTSAGFAVTVRSALSGTQISAVAVEYSGVGSVDQTATAIGTTSTATLSTSAATAVDNELVVSSFGVLYPWLTSFGFLNPSSGYTLRASKLDNLNYTAGAGADNLSNTAGVQKITWTGGSSFQNWIGVIVTFRPSGSAGTVTPSGFNAFETSTAAGSITGVIKTKISATPFTLAVVAINTARTAVATTFVGSVTVELLDAHDNTGALNATTSCRSSWTSFRTVSPNPPFASTDNGRINVSFTETNAWRDVRVRVTYTSGSTTVIGCSTDDFAVRPASFASVQATDATDTTTGVARVLNNASATSGVVHRAGRAFSVLAAAQSSSSTTTSGYDGTPTLAVTTCSQPAGCAAGTLSGTLTSSAGVVSGSATYSEAGVITATLSDTTFAAVDAADSTAAERTITSSAVTIGRFVPDAYQLSVTATPTFAAPACGAGPSTQSFVFVGQPFSFGTSPVVLATPINASGQVLANALPRFGTSAVTSTLAASGAPVTFGGSVAASSVTMSSTASIAFTGSSFSFVRGSTTVASFAPTIAMTVDVSDTTEAATTGNTAIGDSGALVISPIAFTGGAGTFYYGRIQLFPTFGDYRRDMAMPLEVQTWNGLGWMPFVAAGACVSAGPTAFAYSQPTGWLSGSGGAFNCLTSVSSTVTTSNGRAPVPFPKPSYGGASQPSAMTATLNVLSSASGQSCSGAGVTTTATTIAMPWLATPGGANPSARITWGRVRGDAVYVRERFD
jgi:hypothetical protein